MLRVYGLLRVFIVVIGNSRLSDSSRLLRFGHVPFFCRFYEVPNVILPRIMLGLRVPAFSFGFWLAQSRLPALIRSWVA